MRCEKIMLNFFSSSFASSRPRSILFKKNKNSETPRETTEVNLKFISFAQNVKIKNSARHINES